MNSVQKLINQLTQSIQKIEEEEALLNKPNSTPTSKLHPALRAKNIKLDVGGERFTTTLATLTSKKPTFFSVLFSGSVPIDTDQDGCFFLDRSPAVMNLILNYLRGEPLPRLSHHKVELLKKDAEFYELPGLLDLLNQTERETTKSTNSLSTSKSLSTSNPQFLSWPMKSIANDLRELDELLNHKIITIEQSKIQKEQEKKLEAIIKTKISECFSTEKIKLNIGGKIFCTTRKTLVSRDSFFKAKFGGNFSAEQDEEGAYFIDRDGTHFAHILQYLRDGSIPQGLPFDEMSLLSIQADFYNLSELTFGYLPKKVNQLCTLNMDHHFHFGIDGVEGRWGEGVIWGYQKWDTIESRVGTGRVAGPFIYIIPEKVKTFYAILIGGGGGGNGYGQGNSGGGGGYAFATISAQEIPNRRVTVCVGDGSTVHRGEAGGSTTLLWNTSKIECLGGRSPIQREVGLGGTVSLVNVTNIVSYPGGDGASTTSQIPANRNGSMGTGGGGGGNSSLPLAGAGTGEDHSPNNKNGIALWIDKEDEYFAKAGITGHFPSNLFTILVRSLPSPQSDGAPGRTVSTNNMSGGGYFGGGGGGSGSGSGFSGQQGCCCLFWSI